MKTYVGTNLRDFLEELGLLWAIVYLPMVGIGMFWESGSLVSYYILGFMGFVAIIEPSWFTVRGWVERISGLIFTLLVLFMPLYLGMLLATSGHEIGKNVPDLWNIPFPLSWAAVSSFLTMMAFWVWFSLENKMRAFLPGEDLETHQKRIASEKNWAKTQKERVPPNPSSTNNPEQKGEISPADIYPARYPRYEYKDVFGMKELKDKVSATINNFKEEGGNGILFFGDPGNGKTFFAEAIAGEIGFRFIEARTSELTSMWTGETTQKITTLFEAAKLQAPCMIFLDEIDSFLMDRGSNNMQQDARQSANTLLTSISDLNKNFAKHKVLICAATNFPEKLDGAGIREGRFDVKIKIPSPDYEARLGILKSQILPTNRINMEELELSAKRWEGFSVSRIMAIGKMTKRMAREGNKAVDFELLMAALKEVQGRQGEDLSENTLSLAEMAFGQGQKEALAHLASQLRQRDQVEKFGGSIPKGALFYGPPGTGKTTVAKALAKEVGWAFLSSSGHKLLQAPDEIDKLIQKASDLRPAIVFIDEAEDLLADREMNPHTRQVTNKLLASMDGPKPLHDVFFVASTNHPQNLDSAMLRWGRFSEHVDFTPDSDALLGVLQRFMGERSGQVVFSGSLEALVQRLSDSGYTQSDVLGLLNRAISQAVLKRKPEDGNVLMLDFDVMP